jgi:hypothetical protein
MCGCFLTVGFGAVAPGAASVSLCFADLSEAREAVPDDDASEPRLFSIGAGDELVDETAEAGYGREDVRSYSRS